MSRYESGEPERGDRHRATHQKPGVQALVYTQRAHLARAVGDQTSWDRELREALRIYTQMDATGWMARVEKELES